MSGYDTLMTDLGAIGSIPMKVWMHWPAFFIYAVVDFGYDFVLRALPQVGGTAGTVETALIGGMTRVIDHVVWDSVTKRA